jgi:large conductance mechanosensitive channel
MDPLKTVAELHPTQKAKTLFDEFKGFAFKGNVIDLAVGVIIGAAFTKIVDSLVKQIIMPLVSTLLPGDASYTQWGLIINGVWIPLGEFVGEIVNFLLIALVLFLCIVKFMGWLMRTKKAEAASPPPLTKDQELLTEIRDLLKRERSAEAGPAVAQ